MSTFLKALDQAERDRALLEHARAGAMPPPAPVAAVPPPAPVAVVPTPAAAAGSSAADTGVSEDVAPHLVSFVAPLSFEAEQYRTLRHIVEQAHRTAGVRVVAVSAASAGDGKTTTALNLAGALAQASDAKVLVLDADLRHPAVAADLGLAQAAEPGLVDAVVDAGVNVPDVVRRVARFNLSVLAAGRSSSSPYELLRSPRLADIFEQVRGAYDYVVVDTPPLIGLPDCRLLAAHVDTFVIVVTAHKTPRRMLEAALGALPAATILGVVFNGDRDVAAPAAYGRYVRRLARNLGLSPHPEARGA